MESAFLSDLSLQIDAWADMLARQGRDDLFLEVCDRTDVKPKKDVSFIKMLVLYRQQSTHFICLLCCWSLTSSKPPLL